MNRNEGSSRDLLVGNSLRVARAFCGMTQAELAKAVGVTNSTIHHLEAEIRQPQPELLAAIGQATGFERGFFFRPLPEEFREEECHFRTKNIPASVRSRVLAHGSLFGSFVRFLEKRVKLPAVKVPEAAANSAEDAERAAEECRRRLGLGLDRPATNVCRALENAGVVVTRFEASMGGSDASKMDAFSRRGVRPVVVLNLDKGHASRTRWDMAHELGHLVLHVGQPPGEAALEEQADLFARAFLLPRVGFLREFHAMPKLRWELVFALKARWKTSAAAIIRRSYDLGRLDAVEYRRAWKHYMYRGWHKGEPEEFDDEPPESIPTALDLLERAKPESLHSMVEGLGWTPGVFSRVLGRALPTPADDKLGGEVLSLNARRSRAP